MPGKVTGKVVEVSPEGDLVTDISAATLQHAPRDERAIVRCDEHETNGIYGPDHQQPPFTLLAMLNASGKLQLVVVGDSAKIMLGVSIGTPVEVEW
jgi:S-adenosylmethionine hydrolase